MQTNINLKLNRLHDRIERCLEFLSLERLQKDTIDAIKGISGSISSGVAEGIQGIAGNELRNFASEMNKITLSLANSTEHIEGFGDMYLKQIAKIDEGFKERLEALNVTMDEWVQNLQENFDKTSSVITSQVDVFSVQVERIKTSADEISQTAHIEISENIETVTASFENACAAFSEQINEQTKFTQDNLNSIKELIDALEASADNFTDATQKTISSIKSEQDLIQTSVEKLGQSITGIEEQISSYTDNLENISRVFIDTSNRTEAQTKLNQETISDIASVITELQSAIERDKDGIVNAFKPLADEVQNLTLKLNEIGNSQPEANNIISRLFRT